MKIIHCADLHLDSKLTANFSKEKSEERKAELLKTFLRMLEYARENDISAIIIAGDLFDSRMVSDSAMNVVCEGIINNPQIDFYYLKGNHDNSDEFKKYIKNILGIKTGGKLSALPQNLKLFDNKWRYYRLEEEIVIAGIESLTGSSYDELKLNEDDINIVVLHGQETNVSLKEKDSYIIQSGLQRNDDEIINLKALKNRFIDYLALGHIHFYKKDKLDARGSYCYSGCLEGRGFDECGERGFVLLNINEESRKVETQFIPFARRKLYEFEVDISGCFTTSQMATAVLNALQGVSGIQSAFVKLILIGELSAECEKNIVLLEELISDRFYYLKIVDSTKYKVNYNDYRYDESLRGEFVKTVMQAAGLSEEDKAQIIRYGLNALAIK